MTRTDFTRQRSAAGGRTSGILRTRARILDGIRAFFRTRGFCEVDPPIALRYPNIDPNIFPVQVQDPAGRGKTLYLHTSPELSMKKLLAAGSGNIFYLGKVFRDREGSPLHSPEFTMLEWYRVEEPAEAVMRDVEELCRELAGEFAGADTIRRKGSAVALPARWPRWEISEAFRELLGVAPLDREALFAALSRKGLRPATDESWEDLFFRACLEVVEPAAADKGALFLTGYPAALAAMAKRRTGGDGLAERFEGFVAGVELVNGYEELTDPEEQEERLRELAARHEARTGQPLPIDPEFLDALRAGLPPCSGAALGVDRLIMLLAGAESIADVMLP
ncbi:MAG TPA: EF-P lysine aminoacylase GenX [Deltaproteobacteria bacterium]|nr:EF-P lysine aminoacylase GenX [Deltaproteobacteria bacterium]